MRRCRAFVVFLAGLSAAGCGPATEDPASLAPEYYRNGKVVLGSPRLTAGIPGGGELTIQEIKHWLADEANHQRLDFALPPGLVDAEDLIQLPADNPLTRAKIELGRQLFFDPRLSGFDTFRCADCHQPEQFYTAALVMPEVGRNSAVAFNRLFGQLHFWDGKAESLELQPHVPIENPFEMNSSPRQTTEKIRRVPGYRLQFEAIFGEVTFDNICQALACFQRVLVTSPSPWDFHRLQQRFEGRAAESLSDAERSVYQELRDGAAKHPMTEAALRGERLFFSDRARCGHCHSGPNLTDEEFHNVGVGMNQPNPDLGRFKITGRPDDRGAFKTPTLRNVARTAPYMHNGRFDSLREVVDWFDQGAEANEHLDSAIHPLNLTSSEKRDLLAFLKSLNSALPEVETGRLPP